MPAIRSSTIMQFCTNYYVYLYRTTYLSSHFKRTNLSLCIHEFVSTLRVNANPLFLSSSQYH